MDQTAPIIVSSFDLQRLEQLIEQPAYHNFIGAEALLTELARANVVAPGQIPNDVVTMNSTARVEDELSGESHELTLVYPRDADGSPDKVSVLAPVGSAMLGLRVGQSIKWQVPGGRELHLRIVAIRYQPEASGDLHR